MNHGLVDCSVARPLWNWISAIFSFRTSLTSGLKQLLLSLWHEVDEVFSKDLFLQLPVFVLWII